MFGLGGEGFDFSSGAGSYRSLSLSPDPNSRPPVESLSLNDLQKNCHVANLVGQLDEVRVQLVESSKTQNELFRENQKLRKELEEWRSGTRYFPPATHSRTLTFLLPGHYLLPQDSILY